ARAGGGRGGGGGGGGGGGDSRGAGPPPLVSAPPPRGARGGGGGGGGGETAPRLWNTGSWVYAPGLLGRTAAKSPYWPGTVVVLEDERQPELRHLLDHLAKDELGE